MSLKQRLIRRIAAEGPISVAEYMALCLSDPREGYYTRDEPGCDPFGSKGDFITAPEISQMFGELLGLWCADAWKRLLGAPDPVNLVELGPGRGTLMADALRAARGVPGFEKAARIHLVEIGPSLKRKQRMALAGMDAVWHDRFDAVPDGPFLLLANEFFDALPIRQFAVTPQGIAERLVGLNRAGDGLGFALTPGPSSWARLLPPALTNAPMGSVVELSPASLVLVQSISRRIAAQGGAALIVDYGPARSGPGDTLQAARRHGKAGVLDEPGLADLTAHVDFQSLAGAAEEAGARAQGPVAQGELLQRLGIAERARRLKENADSRQRADIEAALRRLIAPEEMGTLFKALALAPRGAGTPAGF
ncbi:MAG: class I SAM-dependent methyltransferase [Rhodospirillales bacterium]